MITPKIRMLSFALVNCVLLLFFVLFLVCFCFLLLLLFVVFCLYSFLTVCLFGSCFRTLAKSQAKVSFTVEVTRHLKGTPREGASCPENVEKTVNNSSYLALYHFNSYPFTALYLINNDNNNKITTVTKKDKYYVTA